jgi:hypothetical protein
MEQTRAAIEARLQELQHRTNMAEDGDESGAKLDLHETISLSNSGNWLVTTEG